MTETIRIGQFQETGKSKSIHFDKVLTFEYKLLDNNHSDCEYVPNEFKYIELICEDYSDGKSLMFAYNNPNAKGRNDGLLIIGKWNDGVV